MRYTGADRKQIKFLEFGLRDHFSLTLRDLGTLKKSTLLVWIPRHAIASVELPRFSNIREINGGFQTVVGPDGLELLLRPGTCNPKVTIRDDTTGKHGEPKSGQIIIPGIVQSLKFMGAPFDLLSATGHLPPQLFANLLDHLGDYIRPYTGPHPDQDLSPAGATVLYFGSKPPEGRNELEVYVCPQGEKKIKLPDDPEFREAVLGS